MEFIQISDESLMNDFQKNKIIFFKSVNYNESTIRALWGLYLNYIADVEIKYGKDLWDLSQEEIQDYLDSIKDKGKSTIASTNVFINKYMKWYSEYYKKNDVREFDLTIEKEIDNSWYISKKDFFSMCDKMLKKTDIINILPLIFARYGIIGKQMINMRSIKWSNINYKTKKVFMYDENVALDIPIDENFLKWIDLAKKYEIKKYEDKEIKNDYILKTQIKDNIITNYTSINTRIYKAYKSIEINRIPIGVLDDCCKIDYLCNVANNQYIGIVDIKEYLKIFNISNETPATTLRLRKLYLNFLGLDLSKRMSRNHISNYTDIYTKNSINKSTKIQNSIITIKPVIGGEDMQYEKPSKNNIIINEYNNIAYIVVDQGITQVKAIIDLENIPKTINLKWYINSNGLVVTKIINRSKAHISYLANLIMNINDSYEVEYKNCDKLDCRRKNLIVIER